MRRGLLQIAATAALLLTGCAESGTFSLGNLEELVELAGLGDAGLDESTVVAGLKEALSIGTQRTVSATSRRDGYLGNGLIRIPLPEELEATTDALRTIGFGARVDELEVAMNRAAERAAGEATPVFVSAIRQMSIQDARGILNGGERAATDFFEKRTTAELTTRFRPIVQDGMEQVGLARLYKDLMARVALLPLVPKPTLDLDGYVTEHALSGLFTVLGQEEARIREDPAARTTELLRTVFGAS